MVAIFLNALCQGKLVTSLLRSPLPAQLLAETHSLNYNLDALSGRVAERLSSNLCRFLADPTIGEAANMAASHGILWGFKEPLSMFYLPLW